MKKIILSILSLTLLLVVSGCGIAENTPDLKADISKEKLPLSEQIDIASVETVKRNTEEKKDEIYVKVSGCSETAECNLQFKLVYNYYTEGGWLLDECLPYNTDEWTATPVQGVSDDEIQVAMQEVADYGYLNEGRFNSVELVTADFDSNSGIEKVYMTLTKTSNFRTLNAELVYTYEFIDEYVDGQLNWRWEHNYDKNSYTVTKDDYSSIAGDWIDPNTSLEYKIEQLSQYEFKLSRHPDKYNWIPYELTFSLANNQVEITKYMMLQGNGVAIYHSNPNRSGARIVFNSDGSIDVEPFLATARGGHIIKK